MDILTLWAFVIMSSSRYTHTQVPLYFETEEECLVAKTKIELHFKNTSYRIECIQTVIPKGISI